MGSLNLKGWKNYKFQSSIWPENPSHANDSTKMDIPDKYKKQRHIDFDN